MSFQLMPAQQRAADYKKIEHAVVGSYKEVEDGFVDRYLAHDGESIEDAKARLKNTK